MSTTTFQKTRNICVDKMVITEGTVNEFTVVTLTVTVDEYLEDYLSTTKVNHVIEMYVGPEDYESFFKALKELE